MDGINERKMVNDIREEMVVEVVVETEAVGVVEEAGRS